MVVPPKAKPAELPPNAGFAGVPKVVAAVVAAVAAPNGKGAVGAGVEETGVDDATVPTPKVKAFDGATEEPNADCDAGASNADFPKVKLDWVVGGAAAVVEAVLVMPKPPNEAVVVFWLDACWPNKNIF